MHLKKVAKTFQKTFNVICCLCIYVHKVFYVILRIGARTDQINNLNRAFKKLEHQSNTTQIETLKRVEQLNARQTDTVREVEQLNATNAQDSKKLQKIQRCKNIW